MEKLIITITAKDKNVIIIGAGDTGARLFLATALKKIVSRLFNLINIRNCQKQITFTECIMAF